MKTATLGEICDRSEGCVQTGPFGSQVHQSDYKEEGVPVVMPQDIVNDRISTARIAYIDDALASKLGRHLLAEGDIVFPRRGEISKRAIVEASQVGYFCGTGCLKISIPPVEVLPRWLFYFLGQEHVVRWIEGKAVGATMLNLNTGILRALPVKYPDIEVQTRIVDCLSAYDDLIETNRRRITLLEESARLLYREWFINLRFPGHEESARTDGVPNGWDFDRLDSALTLQRGFDLPNSARKPGEIPIYASSGVNGFHDVAKVEGPGVVTGRSGTLGLVHYVPGDFWPLNTALWVKDFLRVTPVFAYFMLAEMNLAQYNSGASVPTLDRKVVHPVKVLIPPQDLMMQFGERIDPVFQQIECLQAANSRLTSARDALLPRLMSGALQP